MKVVPIDIDFAGWCEVSEGEQNAWGIVDGDTLVAYRKTKDEALDKLERVSRGEP